MSKSLRLYSSIISFIWQTSARFNDLRNLYTFVWAIVGLIASGGVHLSQWGLYRNSRAKAASLERQYSRWLHNEKIEADKVYRHLASVAFMDWTERSIDLALDTTVLWQKYALVRVAVLYRGRALPLVWVVVEQGSASVALSAYQHILDEAAELLPPNCRVTLLADRGFNDVNLMELIVNLNWHFIFRLKGSLWVYRPFKARCKVNRLMPPKGEIHLYQVAQVTERRFGPVSLALGHFRTPNGYEQWALLSDQATGLETFDHYALRFEIEESFLDDKSAGFQIESSQIDDPDALSRLFLILATATLYLVSTGTAIVAMGYRHRVDTHWHRGISYLQIGWRWTRQALACGERLLSFLWLDSEPDPEPVFASKTQARTPTLAFTAIRSIQ